MVCRGVVLYVSGRLMSSSNAESTSSSPVILGREQLGWRRSGDMRPARQPTDLSDGHCMLGAVLAPFHENLTAPGGRPRAKLGAAWSLSPYEHICMAHARRPATRKRGHQRNIRI